MDKKIQPQIKIIATSSKKHRQKPQDHAQIITLMGVLLALTVFVIAAIPSQLTTLTTNISQENTTDLLPEFIHIKNVFGIALNYNLTNLSYDPVNNTISYKGYIEDLPDKFTNITDNFRTLLLKYDLIFDATTPTCNFYNFTYAYVPGTGYVYRGPIYQVHTTLSLANTQTSITEDVTYLVLCERPTL